MLDRIYCKNFRRIGECDLPLRDGVTTLLGKNGTGKSSIIESITFNLFGETGKGKGKKESCRRVNAAEDDPTYTVVDFTFQGVHYRCRRWYTKKMSLTGNLYSFTDEEYEELSKKPILEFDKQFGTEVANGTSGTTAAVMDIIGVNYKGFLASFLAQQKELDALASFPPEKRKEFFLEILGYDRLEKMKKELGTEVTATQRMLNALQNQNFSIPQLEKEIATLEKELSDLGVRIDKGKQFVTDADKKLTEASEAYNNVRILAEQVRQAKELLQSAQQDKETLSQDVQKLTTAIAENKKKSEGYDANSPVAERLADANDRKKKSEQYDLTIEKKQEAEGALSARKSEYEKNEKRIAELEKLTATVPSTAPIIEEITSIKSQKSAVVQERKTAELGRDKIDKLLNAVKAGDVAECPSCGTEISSAEGQAHLEAEIEQYKKQIEDCVTRENALEEQLKKSESSLELENQRLSTFNMNNTEKTKLQGQNGDLKRYMEENQKTIAGFAKDEQELAAFKMTREEKFRLNEQIAELIQQRQREDEMKKAYYQLQTDEELLKTKQDALQKAENTIKEQSAFVKANEKQAGKIDKIAEEKDIAKARYDKYQEALVERTTELGEKNEALNQKKGNLALAKKNEEELASYRAMHEAQLGAQQVVNSLRGELPARIAPRLAESASHILDIATNGRYTMLELTDTYEVNVYADDAIRPIGAMSGGEADVVALSIRIAIAKMLLESSGIPSQSFILDEIFGALDDERRESTCVALQGIQNELTRILCITHIDEIKDMADYTFVVEMDENNVSYVREVENNNVLKSAFVEERLLEQEADTTIDSE